MAQAKGSPRKPKPITPEEKKAADRMGSRRRRWEKSAGGQARLRQAPELMGEGHEKLGVGQVYAHHGWGFEVNRPGEHHYGQGILHGMEAPGAAPTMRRWEDLHPHEQEQTMRHLAKWGTNLQHMERAFGAQLDQGFARAQHEHEAAGLPGRAKPMYADFYSPDSEHGQAVQSLAQKHNLHPSVASAVVALTSPNTKWHMAGRYPNIEAADHVITHVLGGGDPARVHETAHVRHPETGEVEYHAKGPKKGQPKSLQGYGTNMVKAATQLENHIRTGEGFSGFGPKTGPFHNAFNDYTHSFLVSDVHSGGGGMLPHLGHKKDPVSGKSERELAVEKTPNFHAAADYVARRAMDRRGLAHTHRAQAVQWGEEQIARAEKTPSLGSAIARPSRADEFMAGHQKTDHPSLF